MLIAFFVLLVAVGFLLALAIPRGGPLHAKEPGFIEGVPQWEASDFPLGVAVFRYSAEGEKRIFASGDEAAGTVDEIINRVNVRLGFSAFEPVAVTDEGKVRIVVNAPQLVGESGVGQIGEALFHTGEYTRIHHINLRAAMCEVRTSNTGTLEMLGKAVYHGLGHCLGLADGDAPPSIMQRELSSTPDRVIPEWVSDNDRRIIRERYARPL
jgi:hypothetical protein